MAAFSSTETVRPSHISANGGPYVRLTALLRYVSPVQVRFSPEARPSGLGTPMPTIHFWQVCVLWLLGLGVYSMRQADSSLYAPDDISRLYAAMPSVGQYVALPPTLETVKGDPLETLEADRPTLFLLAWASCQGSKQEVDTYPDIISMLTDQGIGIRVLVRPGLPEDDEWFLNQMPANAPVVMDSMGIAQSMFQARLTPSAVVIGPDGIVKKVLVPSPSQWPITEAMAISILEEDHHGT
jgi:hypothetical protein